jgi:hypothetical protein
VFDTPGDGEVVVKVTNQSRYCNDGITTVVTTAAVAASSDEEPCCSSGGEEDNHNPIAVLAANKTISSEVCGREFRIV